MCHAQPVTKPNPATSTGIFRHAEYAFGVMMITPLARYVTVLSVSKRFVLHVGIIACGGLMLWLVRRIGTLGLLQGNYIHL